MLKLIIFSKKDCHLCDIAKEKLLKLQHELQFSITEVNIEKDREVFEKYKHMIPVIEIGGEILFTGRIDKDRLKKVLRQKSRP